MHLRGQIPGHSQGPDTGPELALLAAILLQAIRDAREGDHDAAGWLTRHGADLADVYFDIAPDVWAGGAALTAHGSGQVRTVYRSPGKAPSSSLSSAERSRLYRESKKAARLAQCG